MLPGQGRCSAPEGQFRRGFEQISHDLLATESETGRRGLMQTTKAPKLKTKRSKISYAKWGYIFIAPFFLAYALFHLRRRC